MPSFQTFKTTTILFNDIFPNLERQFFRFITRGILMVILTKDAIIAFLLSGK